MTEALKQKDHFFIMLKFSSNLVFFYHNKFTQMNKFNLIDEKMPYSTEYSEMCQCSP